MTVTCLTFCLTQQQGAEEELSPPANRDIKLKNSVYCVACFTLVKHFVSAVQQQSEVQKQQRHRSNMQLK